MRFRKLRIAWSVFWGVDCVLLVVFWVRSYWRLDIIDGPAPVLKEVSGISVLGRMIIHTVNTDTPPDWRLRSDSMKDNLELIKRDVLPDGNPWLGSFNGGANVVVPHWLMVFLFAAFAAAPWLRWRFSLRTLLIATTLVAVVLGLAAWAAS